MAKDVQVFRQDVQCFVQKLTYDFKEKTGQLLLEDGSCTDMSGCIKLFKAIDPEVVGILTISGGRRDTGYVLVDGEWQSRVDSEMKN